LEVRLDGLCTVEEELYRRILRERLAIREALEIGERQGWHGKLVLGTQM
jgi:hypothetical protein